MAATENCESYHRTQTRLLEIYKIQMSAVNDVSNRRININRHYLIVMSGVVIIFTAFTQLEGKPLDLLEPLVKYFHIATGIIGCVISSIWLLVTDSYLRRNSRKYEILKHLESELEYAFLSREWSTLGSIKLRKNYRSLATIEFAMPFAFFIIFACLYVIGIIQMETHSVLKVFLISIPLVSVSFLLTKLVKNNRQEKLETSKLRKSYNSTD